MSYSLLTTTYCLFRCANELKLEESDFGDDPTFLVDQLQARVLLNV